MGEWLQSNGVSFLVSGLGTCFALIANRIAGDIRKMAESVDALNVKIAVVVEKVESHGYRLDKLEETSHGKRKP